MPTYFDPYCTSLSVRGNLPASEVRPENATIPQQGEMGEVLTMSDTGVKV